MEIAQETLAIIEANEYYAFDKKIALSENPDALRKVIVYSPQKVACAVSEQTTLTGNNACSFRVDLLDSLTSAKQNGLGKTAVLNFANAFRAGGGFLRGAIAQEEAICRCSSLYASISSEAASEMYEYNRSHVTPEGSDYMLLSPDVVVFRDKDCNLLQQPYTVSVLTAAAPNLYGEAAEIEELRLADVMRLKIKNIASVAAQNRYDTLILGAWGCGAFGHNAANVAKYFYDVFIGDNYKRFFKRIVFSVLARDEYDYNYHQFSERFKNEVDK